MKTRLSLIITLYAMFISFAHAQKGDSAFYSMIERMELQIRQKPGTERILAGMVEKIKTKSDTLYAMIYRPTYCPRCETPMHKFDQRIKRISPEAETVLISVYNDAAASKGYHEREGFVFDHYIYDTDETFAKTLSLNLVNMNSTFVMKIRKSTGEMIVGASMNELSDNFLKGLINYRMGMPRHDYMIGAGAEDTGTATGHEPECEAMDGSKARTYALRQNAGLPVSAISSMPVMRDGTLCINDEFNKGVMVFRRHGRLMKLDTIISPTEEEKLSSVEIPRKYYEEMEEGHELFYMAMTPKLSADGQRLLISYSMPYLRADYVIENGDTADIEIEYFNKGIIIERDLRTYRPGRFTPLNIDMDNLKYFYNHDNFCMAGDSLILGCNKLTWPIGVPTEYYKDKDELDPFLPAFYTTRNPICAVFDKNTGLPKSTFGQIDSYAERTRLGYAFVLSVMDTDGRSVAYTDALSGQIYVADMADLNKPTERYCVFTLNADDMHRPDSALFYKDEHRSQYTKYFDRRIKDIVITDTNIYALTAYGTMSNTQVNKDIYVFTCADRRTGSTEQHTVPRPTDATVLTYGIDREGDACRPFVIYRHGGDVMLRVFGE